MFGPDDGFFGGTSLFKELDKMLLKMQAETTRIRLCWPGTRPFRYHDGRRLAGF